MTKKELIAQAKKDYEWFIHNVNANSFPNNPKAIEYATKVYDHALYSGYITEEEHKKLCLGLPFDLNLIK